MLEDHLQAECPLREIGNMEEPEGRLYFGVSTMHCKTCRLTLQVNLSCGIEEEIEDE